MPATRLSRPATLWLALFLALLLCVGGVSCPAADDPAPTAQELLALVRLNESSQSRVLAGRLRVAGRERKLVIPFQLEMQGNTISYRFSDPDETFVLRLQEKAARLDRVTGGGAGERIIGAKLDQPVRGTDISCEDLSLKFLYWNNAVVEPQRETLMTRVCWIVRATPPEKGASQYEQVRLWIERTGGLLQIECSAGGRVIRRFKVVDVQSAKDTGGYILKSMRIQRLDEAGRDRYPTYLEVRQEP